MAIIELDQKNKSQEASKKSRQYLLFSRALTLAISLLILPLLIGVMGIIAIAIVLDSPGSPLFVHERIGKYGRRFRLYKFRTMRQSYDERRDRDFMQAFVIGQLGSSELVNNEAVNNFYRKLGCIYLR